ncbi:hypothetical protein FXO37_00890 [Capsicum annuum]|nr:hypothetical protein FXO37_00890 [Capsicum annuum]
MEDQSDNCLTAKKAYPHLNRPFKDYALLGDDILITDKQVALQYRKLLDRLDVTIFDAKPIVSDTGAFESKMMNGIVALHSPPMRKYAAEKNGTLFRFFSKVQNVSSNIQYDSTRSSFVEVMDSSQLKGPNVAFGLLRLAARRLYCSPTTSFSRFRQPHFTRRYYRNRFCFLFLFSKSKQ